MSKVGPIIMFGFTIAVAGLYYAVWEGSRSYFNNLIINDIYYELIYWGWRMIPAVLLIVGIMCLIMAGISESGGKGVGEY